MSDVLKLHHIETSSLVNGPNKRFTFWTQGCSLGCRECFNPDTHSPHAGFSRTVDSLLTEILSQKDIEGITVSGGEPLQQIVPITLLLEEIRKKTNLGVILFSGFDWDEIQTFPQSQALLSCLDTLIAGRYIHTRRIAHHLTGSDNKTFHFLSNRYQPQDFNIEPAEIFIAPDGTITMTGINPIQW